MALTGRLRWLRASLSPPGATNPRILAPVKKVPPKARCGVLMQMPRILPRVLVLAPTSI